MYHKGHKEFHLQILQILCVKNFGAQEPHFYLIPINKTTSVAMEYHTSPDLITLKIKYIKMEYNEYNENPEECHATKEIHAQEYERRFKFYHQTINGKIVEKQ
ncbi:MAG: hypothetical protein LBR26_08205 [Prevotella sp.]|nr:hypothetical protein [Prevotella sp.]